MSACRLAGTGVVVLVCLTALSLALTASAMAIPFTTL
jgi:hypothetical protein